MHFACCFCSIDNNNNSNNNNRIQRSYSRFFYNLVTVPWTVSNTYAQVAGAKPCANHVQHIERLSHASVMLRTTWYKGTAQLLSLTELKSHLFEHYFIGWTIKPMKEGRKPEYPEKTPGDNLNNNLRKNLRDSPCTMLIRVVHFEGSRPEWCISTI